MTTSAEWDYCEAVAQLARIVLDWADFRGVQVSDMRREIIVHLDADVADEIQRQRDAKRA